MSHSPRLTNYLTRLQFSLICVSCIARITNVSHQHLAIFFVYTFFSCLCFSFYCYLLFHWFFFFFWGVTWWSFYMYMFIFFLFKFRVSCLIGNCCTMILLPKGWDHRFMLPCMAYKLIMRFC
jgi:hypothetical protein